MKARATRRALVGALLTVVATLSLGALPAGATVATASASGVELPALQFDLNDTTRHVVVSDLPDGTRTEIGAEPVVGADGLDGTWHVWGDNAAFRMEYYVTYQSIAGTPYTRAVGSPYGLKVVGRAGLTWDTARVSVPRAAETASEPSLVEGSARFHYPLGVIQTGGVRATVKNSVFTATLW